MNPKETEEALEKSEAKYRLLAENMTEVVWTLDMESNWTYVSPSVLKQTGFTVEEQMELGFQEVMTPESMAILKELYTESMELEEFFDEPMSELDSNPLSVTVELQRYTKDGSLLWIESTLKFLRDAEGNPVGIVGVDRDISKRKKDTAAPEESKENQLD